MRRCHYLVIVGLNLLISTAWAQSFCVQSFNAYGPIYARAVLERSQKTVEEILISAPCELVQFQEVWNESQINLFSSGLQRTYLESAPNRDKKIGLMSFVKGSIQNTETYFFTINNLGGILDSVRETFKIKKAFHVVRARLNSAFEEMYFVNTHLHPSSQAVRITQILDLLRWRRAHQDLKLILTGDFNADIFSLERNLLLNVLGLNDAMAELYRGQYPQGFCTYCKENPRGWTVDSHTFDYIFYSNSGDHRTQIIPTQGVVNMKGASGSPLSDHYGLRVQFNIAQPAEGPKRNLEKSKVLFTLRSALKVLEGEKNEDFDRYRNLLRKLMNELEPRHGEHGGSLP